MQNSSIRAIFFDLDGTLTDYEASVDYAMTRMWEAIRDDCPLGLEAFLQAQWDFMAEMEDKEARGEIPRSFLKDRKIRKEEFLRRIDPRLVKRFDNVGEVYTKLRSEHIVTYPGTRRVLEELGRRYALGVITEGDGTNQRRQLEAVGIAHLLEHIVVSDEIGLHKPDPAIYEKACELASVPPEEAALVGDRIDWDIAPAKRLGMLTVLSRQQQHYRTDETGEVSPDFTITDIGELLSIFR